MPLQIRRGTDAERQSMTQPLAEGELLYVTDTQKMYVGGRDIGGTPVLGGIQITGYTNEDAQDTIGTVLAAGPHNGVNFIYNDTAGTISASIDLTNYVGTVKADAFKGSLVGDNSTILIDGVSNRINLDGTVKGDIVPDSNEAYDIGSASSRFRDLYLSGSSIELGSATISAIGSAVDLPAGSTVAGTPIINTNGSISSDITGSVFGVNSSVIVDATDNSLHTGLLDIVDDSILSNNFNLKFGSATDPLFLQSWQPSDGAFFNFYGEINTLTGDTPWLQLQLARGTNASPTIVSPDDLLSGLLIFGYDGTDYTRSVTVAGQVDGTVSTGMIPGKFLAIVQSSAPGAVAGDNQILSFDSKGVLNAPVVKLTNYETSSLPANPEKGWMVFDSDTNEFKGWNGTSWVVLG